MANFATTITNGVEWGELPSPSWRESSDGEETGERLFVVIWRRPGLRPSDILGLKFIPRKWDPSPDRPYALATGRSATPENRFTWKVRIEYGTTFETPIDQERNPLARPAKIKIRGVRETVPAERDLSGKPYTNTAGDAVIGLQVTRTRKVLHVEKNVSAVPDWFETIDDSVNAGDIRIKGRLFKARTLKICEIEVDDVEDAQRLYYVVRFQLEHNADTWDVQYLNTGYRELVIPAADVAAAIGQLGATSAEEREALLAPRKVEIVAGEPEQRISDPAYLDDKGRALRETNGSLKTTLKPEELVVIRRRHFPEFDFSRLPLK